MTARRWRWARAVALAVVLAPVGVTAGWAQPTQGGAVTVSTIAGPGFCAGTARIDEAASAVRAASVDDSGRVYLHTGSPADGLVARIDADGTTSTVRTGYGDEPTERGESQLAHLAADRADGVFVAARSAVVHVRADGSATVVAGQHPAGPSAGAARLARVTALATDSVGNLWVADATTTGASIRVLNRGSTPVTLAAGTPGERTVTPGSLEAIATTDNAVPGSLRLTDPPTALAVDGARLYVAWYSDDAPRPRAGIDLVNLGSAPLTAHGVRVPAGEATTIAGGRLAGFAGDGGAAARAALGYVPGIAVSPSGALVLADLDHHRIRQVDADGTITTLAGTRGVARLDGGFNANALPATSALLAHPSDVDVGPDGRVYVVDQGNGRFRYIDSAGVIRAAGGNGLGLTWSCSGDAAAGDGAEVVGQGSPASVVADTDGTTYLAVPGLNQVKVVDSAGAVRTLVGAPAGCGTAHCPNGDGGPARLARLAQPSALTLGNGGLYIFEAAASRVRFVNLDERPLTVHGVTVEPDEIATVAGNGAAGFAGDGGPARDAQFAASAGAVYLGGGGLGSDAAGNLYVADGGNSRVRRVDAAGVITTVLEGPQRQDLSRCCYAPAGLAIDHRGNLYVADALAPRVWYWNQGELPVVVHGRHISPGAVEPIAGDGTRGVGGDDEAAVDAQLFRPVALELGQQGDLYVADQGEHAVRRVDNKGIISTLVGTGGFGFTGDELDPRLTALNLPADVALDHCGNLLVADQGNDRIRRVNLTSPCRPRPTPHSAALTPGEPEAAPASWPHLRLVMVGLAFAGAAAGAIGAARVVGRR